MFKWFAKIRKREVLKLIFQNNSFLSFYTNLEGEDEALSLKLDEVKRITNSFYSEGDISAENLKYMMDVNSFLRRLYKNDDPEMKLYNSGMLSKKPKSFDIKYSPILGWKKYYEDYGL